MGLKEILFSLFILGATIFPLFFNIQKSQNRVEKSLPDIKIENGTFHEFSPILSKKGDFKEVSYYVNNNSYLITKFNFLTKNEKKDEWVKLSSNKAEVKNNLIYFKTRAFYFSKDYNFSADNAIYNIKQKSLKGNNFKLFSKSFYGTGDSLVYLDNKIKASNIKYIIKDDK